MFPVMARAAKQVCVKRNTRQKVRSGSLLSLPFHKNHITASLCWHCRRNIRWKMEGQEFWPRKEMSPSQSHKHLMVWRMLLFLLTPSLPMSRWGILLLLLCISVPCCLFYLDSNFSEMWSSPEEDQETFLWDLLLESEVALCAWC